MCLSKFAKKYPTLFGISFGLSLLAIAGFLLIYAPDQTGISLMIVGSLSAVVSMFLIGADVLKSKQINRDGER